MSKLLQYLVNKPSVKHKVLPGLQKMQTKGEVTNVPERISYSDPRYREMYKNRQVGLNYDGAISLPELDEVTVTAPRSYSMKSLKDFTTAGLYGAPATALNISMIPQAAMTEAIELYRRKPYDFSNASPNLGYFGSNQRNLSNTLGYKDPQGFLQNAANVGLSMVDPLLLAGLSKNLVRNIGKKFVSAPVKRLPTTTNADALRVLEDFKARIQTPEGIRRMKALGIDNDRNLSSINIVDDVNTHGYYEPRYNEIAINPNKTDNVTRVVRHELEHGSQMAKFVESANKLNKDIANLKYLFKPKALKEAKKIAYKETTEIDDNLAALELKETPEKIDWKNVKSSTEKYPSSNEYLLDNKRATNYFNSGSRGKEKSPFLAEVQQYMMDTGIIPSRDYVNITPKMVEQTMKKAALDKDNGGMYLRFFNIMKDSNFNYDLAANELNKMLGITGAVGTAGLASQNIEQKKKGGNVSLPKMQIAGQYTAERDATTVSNTPILSKMFGAQREVDVNKLDEDSFKQKYNITPHQYKMRSDSNYAQAFQRQMDERRQNDPNYSEINLPATDIRSKNYRGNPNLALIPKGATGPARAQQEQLFADITSMAAPLLPVKSLVRGLQAGKAISTAPKIIDKLISAPSPVNTAATQSIDDSGLIINDEVYRQWRNARQSANVPESRTITRSTNTPSESMSMNAWGTPNWNAAAGEPVQNIEPYRAAWEGFERRTPEWINQTVRDWPTSNYNSSLYNRANSLIGNVARKADERLGQLFSKTTNAPVFDADEVTRLINENLSKGVGVKKENLGLQVRNSPLPYDLETGFRIETLIDNNKVGSILFQRNMTPYKPKTFSQLLLDKLPTPFERWQNTPGFKKTNDFPFQDYDVFNPIKDPTGKTFNTANDLYKTGISGEFNKAINEALKAKGLGNILSGGTGHSTLGEARWKNLVQKGLAEDLGDGYYKLKKQGGPVILPKMQMAGQNNNLPQRVSINDPRYAELYKNRQVGSFYDGAYSLPDLDEVTVTGKDERVKEGMSRGINKFYGHASELMSLPQTEMMKFLTGKRQTPSQAWGFDTTNKPWYHPKTVSNFLMDAALDPTNLVGVGIVDDLTKGAVRAAAQNTVSKTLQRGLSPWGYDFENIARVPQNLIRNLEGKSKKLSSAVQKTIDEGRAQFVLPALKNREDAWSTYLGLDRDFNTMKLVGSDDATGLSKYEYTNPIVFEKSSPRPNPKSGTQAHRIDKALYDTSEGRLYNKRILESDYRDNSDIIDLNIPGSSTVGNDKLFGTMGGFQKYVSPDGKHLMYRDVWDLQPFSRLTSSQLPRDMVGNAIRRFEVSSLIPGARPFVAEGKLGDIKTKFLPAQPYKDIRTRYNEQLSWARNAFEPDAFIRDLDNPTPEEIFAYDQAIKNTAKRSLIQDIKNEKTFLNPVPDRDFKKYVDTNPYTRFGDSTPDLTGFDFSPSTPEKLLKNIQNIGNQPVNKFNMGGVILDPRGQWAHPGKRTIVPTPTGRITMQGVPYPVYGQDETGFGQMMYPGGEYKFPGQMVDEIPMFGKGGQHGGLDRWFAEKWVDVKTGKPCGRQEGESRAGYPACRPSKRVSSETPKTSSEMSSAEKAKFKRTKTSSERIPYNHKK